MTLKILTAGSTVKSVGLLEKWRPKNVIFSDFWCRIKYFFSIREHNNPCISILLCLYYCCEKRPHFNFFIRADFWTNSGTYIHSFPFNHSGIAKRRFLICHLISGNWEYQRSLLGVDRSERVLNRKLSLILTKQSLKNPSTMKLTQKIMSMGFNFFPWIRIHFLLSTKTTTLICGLKDGSRWVGVWAIISLPNLQLVWMFKLQILYRKHL